MIYVAIALIISLTAALIAYSQPEKIGYKHGH